MISYLIIFIANVATDVLAVWFIQQVTRKNRIRASLVSVAIVSLYALSTIYIVQSAWYIIPTGLGAFVGCCLCVGKKKD